MGLLIRGSLVQAHPEAPKNERVTQVTLFCFCPPEQILVINTGYFKGDIIEYQSLYGIASYDVMEENSKHFFEMVTPIISMTSSCLCVAEPRNLAANVEIILIIVI